MPFDLTLLFEQRPGTILNAIWVLPGRQLGVQDGQHGSQDGLLGVQDGPTCRPEAVPNAFLRDLDATKTNPKRPEIAKTRVLWIFFRFWTIFRRFFLDFWSL